MVERAAFPSPPPRSSTPGAGEGGRLGPGRAPLLLSSFKAAPLDPGPLGTARLRLSPKEGEGMQAERAQDLEPKYKDPKWRRYKRKL